IDRVLVPCTVQLPATSASVTAWAPAARLASVAVAFTPIGWLAPPSMAKVYPFLSGSGPVVTVVIWRLPAPGGGAEQAMVYTTPASAPALTFTGRELSPWIRQLADTPLSPTK